MKMPLKFCANLSFMFQEVPCLLERFKVAKDAGFTAVEIGYPYDYTPEQLVAAKNNAGIETELINIYPGDMSVGDRGLAAVPGRENDFKISVDQSVEYAKALGCKKMHIMAGCSDSQDPDVLKLYEKNIRYATSVLQQADITALIEPINNYSVPNYFLNDYAKGLQVVKNINSTHLKLQLDIFHLQHICGNITKNIEQLIPYVGHIQVAQVPDRSEPDTAGEVDYRYVFALLEKIGYKGWIGLEYKPKSTTLEGLKWVKNMGFDL